MKTLLLTLSLFGLLFAMTGKTTSKQIHQGNIILKGGMGEISLNRKSVKVFRRKEDGKAYILTTEDIRKFSLEKIREPYSLEAEIIKKGRLGNPDTIRVIEIKN